MWQVRVGGGGRGLIRGCRVLLLRRWAIPPKRMCHIRVGGEERVHVTEYRVLVLVAVGNTVQDNVAS